MCNYIKDDGEQCGRDEKPFCHQHRGTAQAKQWRHIEERFEEAREETRAIISGLLEDESGRSGDFNPEWTPTTCDGCDAAIRVVCARIDEAAHQPRKVMPTFALTCQCGDSVQWNPDWNTIPKSEIPAKWLFEDDRKYSWDAEEGVILDSKRLVDIYNEDEE